MHRGLRIPEVVSMIVAQLGRNSLSELAALAQCSIFHDPALDALWNEQWSLELLFRCMPADLWRVDLVDGIPTMRLQRPVKVADWDRVLKYSFRIKSLVLVSAATNESLAQVFEVVRLSFPGDYLLSNLIGLHWHPEPPVKFSDIDLFLGPRITTISLSRLDMHQLSILTTLTRRFHNLKEVDLRGYSVDDDVDSQCRTALSVFICGLHHVRYLRLGCGLDAQAVTHLGRLSTLDTWHFTPRDWSSLEGLPQRSLFAHLRDFWCSDGGPFELIAPFLRSWANPRLRSLQIRSESTSSDATEELCREISGHCSHDALGFLQLNTGPFGFGTADCRMHGRALKHLFCFTNLTYVTIRSPMGFVLDDETLAELAAAWPRLEKLYLTAYEHMDQCGTLLALQAFARRCSNLNTLHLSFDALTVPSIHSESSEPRISHSALVKLNVAESPISHAVAVADFISAIFPGLADLSTALEADDIANMDDPQDPINAVRVGHHKRWKNVERLLRAKTDMHAAEPHSEEQNVM
ncbi:hypothetical protein K438DRAFT_1943073 [Mycena galopus ATCC 62051]|nr:hypothetical protein K438DRAFT_1943073 [Mycena galopus ATCC 62051]